MAATPSDLICTPENERPTNRQKTDNMTDDLPDIQVRVDLTDRIKAKLRRWLYQIESNKLLLIGFTIAFIIWTASVLCAIILERKYIDNSPNNVTTVDGMSTALNVYTYAATYSANKTQFVTLQLLTQNSKVWAIEGDCIRITKNPLTAYNCTLLHVQRFEAVFNKEGIPLFALANSYLIYTITAVSAIKNKTGCVFFYFFNTKEAIEDFLRSNDPSNQLNVQGYYNKSIKCIKTDGLQHDAFFSLNSTGETFVGILANVSTNITYRVRGIIIEYNTSNCQQERIHNLTYDKPLKINICKNIICAFKSNETTIVIDSKEQGVHIHWEPKPLELTLAVWIIIMLLGVLVAILGIVAILHVKRCLYKCKRACTCMAEKTEARQPLLGKRDDIKTVLYEVLESYHAVMSTLFSKNINEIAERMHRNDIITNDVYHNPSCDAIIGCFKGKLSYIHAHGSNQQNIADHCNSFIKSIQEMKKEEKDENEEKEENDHWVTLADAIKKGWTTKTKKHLNIDLELI